MSEPRFSERTTTRGLLLVLSGPSGSGKTTLVRRLVESNEFPITLSVSATSRPARPGEIDGRDYYFLSREEFERRRERGDFLESAEVHGNLYGTPKQPVDQLLAAGRWVLLEIDPQGYRQVVEATSEALGVFVRPPSIEDLEQRLRARETDPESIIAGRLADAAEQLRAAPDYEFQIVNDDLDQALRGLRTLLWGLRFIREKESEPCTTN